MKQTSVVAVVTFLLVTATSFAQNMNSPYSVYGIGDIDFRSYNRTSGMAGTGIALPSSFYVIDNNPASIARLQRSFYQVDASAVGKTVTYKGTTIDATNNNNRDFWIKRFGISVKLNNTWASAAGMRQFSNVNYLFQGSKSVEGSATTYSTTYEGDGGLNEYYWTNAFAIGRHFSLGLRSSIIAGPINQSEIIIDDYSQKAITTKQQDYFGQFRAQAGALYTAKLDSRWDVSLGARFSPKTKMLSERTITVTENSTILVDEEFIKNNRFFLPMTWAGGIAFKRNNRTTFAFDYSHEDWNSLGIRETGWRMVNSDRISAGFEFSKQQYVGKVQVEKRYFQVGAFLNNSPLQVRNQPIQEYGITAGMGGALNSSLLYNLSLEVGTRGTTQAGLIKENFVQMTIGFSYRDFLFSKGRRYD